MIKPYYKDDWNTIYCGDAMDILPQLPIYETVITDPVWPNNRVPEFVGIDPYKTFNNFLNKYSGYKRIAVELGVDSNPNILNEITLPFFRVAYLRYRLPGHKGRLLNNGDMGYLYGEVPRTRPGFKLVPGESIEKGKYGKETKHPCPRKLDHVKWLVNYWSNEEDIILDPFMGSGTTLLAAKILGRKSVGIEINIEWCKMTVNRLSQCILDFSLVD